MTPDPARVLRLKAEACRLLADISKDVMREAHWLEQAHHWETLATKVAREQSRKSAPTIVLSDAWPVTTQSAATRTPGHLAHRRSSNS